MWSCPWDLHPGAPGGGAWLPERMTHTALSLRHLLDEFGLVATVYTYPLDQADLCLGKVFMGVRSS